MTQVDSPPQIARRPPRKTQAERRSISERRIIEAAIRVIGRKGTVGLTLAEVGAEAGYSRGLAAHLFGNKEKLLLRVVETFMVTTRGQLILPEFIEGGSLDALIGAIRQWVTVGVRHPQYYRTFQILTGEAACEDLANISVEMRARMREINSSVSEQLTRLLQQGQARGEISVEIDAAYTALTILSMMRGLIAQWILDPESINLVSICNRFLQDLARELRPIRLRGAIKQRARKRAPKG